MKTLLFGNGGVSLNEVYPYQGMDFAPEAAFDDLIRLAACICQTPIALLCVFDSRRWCLKSQVSLDPRSTEAYLALCTETILKLESWDSRVLSVEDASADQRFANDELVKSQVKVRFYAGIPLVTPQGIVLGILAVMDRVPRSLTLQQKEALVALSTQAISLTACCANMHSELRNNLTNLKRRVNKRQQPKEARQAYIKNSQISS